MCPPRARSTITAGTLFGRNDFVYQPQTDSYLCPASKTVRRKQINRKELAVIYQAQAADCGACSLKLRCTQAAQRTLTRHMDEDALNRMHARATPALMRLRRCTVEHPFGTIKYRIFGHPRFLLRRLRGAHTEISLAIMAYNLKRMLNVLGATQLARKLNPA